MLGLSFGQYIKKLSAYLASRYEDYEILIVENMQGVVNSRDLSETLATVQSIRYIELAFDIPEYDALELALKCCIGDYVVYLNPMQDNVEEIAPIVSLCKAKNCVVVGVAAQSSETIGYKLARPIFSMIAGILNYNLPKGATTLRCISRAVVNVATMSRSRTQQIFLRISDSGFEYEIYRYSTLTGDVKRFAPRFIEALNLLVHNSTKPLRLVSLLGFLGSIFSFLFSIYSFVSHFLLNNVISGWSSIVVIMSFLFMILFFILIFLGEYLLRILSEKSGHDKFAVIGEKTSSVMLGENRFNVIDGLGSDYNNTLNSYEV
jgi:hypothetical protein